ncbi:histone H3.v1-like [Leptopilina boulardi]|uniref:histone H3.v1-like n=1 Tax=Leptopilina boulardi TaxID=63433 RepID=UPI0021F511D7|nr:histone H3.v1-like [Leptopilina boulardi]
MGRVRGTMSRTVKTRGGVGRGAVPALRLPPRVIGENNESLYAIVQNMTTKALNAYFKKSNEEKNDGNKENDVKEKKEEEEEKVQNKKKEYVTNDEEEEDEVDEEEEKIEKIKVNDKKKK